MELCSSYLTLSGSTFGELPKHGLFTRSNAAIRAGFTGIGACSHDLVPGLTAHSYLPATVRELEWADLTRPDWNAVSDMFTLADKLGTVRRIHAGSAYQRDRTETAYMPEANALRTLARMAEDHELKVCVEPVAFGAFPTLDDVMSLIKESGGENMGLLYDTWHVYRTCHALPFIDASAIASVQLSGTFATETTDTLSDAMNRDYPDSGIDCQVITRFVCDLICDGYSGPFCAEIPNARFRANGDCDTFAANTYSRLTEVIRNATEV